MDDHHDDSDAPDRDYNAEMKTYIEDTCGGSITILRDDALQWEIPKKNLNIYDKLTAIRERYGAVFTMITEGTTPSIIIQHDMSANGDPADDNDDDDDDDTPSRTYPVEVQCDPRFVFLICLLIGFATVLITLARDDDATSTKSAFDL